MKLHTSVPALAAVGVCAATVVWSLNVTRSPAQETGHAQTSGEASPIYGVTIPAGYREWPLINVAQEAGDLNDLRAILGNSVAFKALQDETLTFPDGAIIARLAWKYVPSAENNANHS